jgi:hypothetical protein
VSLLPTSVREPRLAGAGVLSAISSGRVAPHPYRARPTVDPAPDPARLERAWSHAFASALVVGGAPAFLVALCLAVRAYEGPWVMPATILYPAIGYAVFVLCACAIDAARR